METFAHRAVGTGRMFVVQGDLTRQQVEGIVNAANEHLAHGGGVAAAIVRTGGRVIQEESDHWVRDHGPIGPGVAAVTTGGALQASHVIHVVGPRYRDDHDNEALLAEAVVAALNAAEEKGLVSIAMPAISAGVFGYPRRAAAVIIVAAVDDWLDSHLEASLREVRLVGFDRAAADDFAAAMESA